MRTAMWVAALPAALAWSTPARADQTAGAAAPTPTGARPLSLADARALAVAGTEDVSAARATRRRAHAQVRAAWSAFLPQLDGTASYERSIKSEFEGLFDAGAMNGDMGGEGGGEGGEMMEGAGELPFGLANTWRLGLRLTQELWNFGRSTNRLSGARAGVRQADIALGSAVAQAELNAVQAYYDALLADQLLAIAQVTLAQAQETLQTTELGRRQGQVPEFDLLRAQVTRDNQQSVVTQRLSDRDLALIRLKQVIGLPLAESIHLSTPLEQASEVNQAEALARESSAAAASAPAAQIARALTGQDIARAEAEASRRAPVRQARELLSAREAALGAARAERWPSLSVTSDYGIVNYPIDLFPGTDDWRTNWTVGVFLTVPLFTGFRTVANIDAAAADVDEARVRLRQTERAAAVDGLSAAEQMAVARAAWQQSARTASQAERAYQIAQLRFQQGISTHLDLVDARVQLDQARGNRARAAHDLHIARVRVELLPQLPLSGAAEAVQTTAAGPAETAGSAPSAATAQGARPATGGTTAPGALP